MDEKIFSLCSNHPRKEFFRPSFLNDFKRSLTVSS